MRKGSRGVSGKAFATLSPLTSVTSVCAVYEYIRVVANYELKGYISPRLHLSGCKFGATRSTGEQQQLQWLLLRSETEHHSLKDNPHNVDMPDTRPPERPCQDPANCCRMRFPEGNPCSCPVKFIPPVAPRSQRSSHPPPQDGSIASTADNKSLSEQSGASQQTQKQNNQ